MHTIFLGKTIRGLHTIALSVFDFLFPSSGLTKELETMQAGAFRTLIPRPYIEPDLEVYALCEYRNKYTRRAVRELKNKGNMKIITLLGELMYTEILDEVTELRVFSGFENPLLIPIPLSKERREERGFNQCELLAHTILAHDTSHTITLLLDVLQKHIHTPQQRSASRSKRLHNLAGCFSVKDPALVKNRNIILLDDVVTTGSTINEARKTLIASGARKVIAFAVAH